MSEEACTKSELEVFRPINVQVALTDGRWQAYQPLNALTNADIIEFIVPATSNEVIDMNNISLYVKAKIVKLDGTNIDEADTIHPVDNFLQSLFRHTEVSVNGQLITRSSRDNSYKDYMKRILLRDTPYNTAKKQFQNRLVGFCMTEAGKGDATTIANDSAAKQRAKWIAGSKTFELRGTPQVDLFETDRSLIPGADLQLKFYLNDPAFFLQRPKTTGTRYKVVFETVELYVRRMTVAPSFVNELNSTLKTKNAIYPMLRSEMTSLTLPQGIMQFTKENLSRGPLPKRVFIGLVDAKAYAGDFSMDPFNFQHFNISEIALFENGFPIAQQPLKTDFKNNNETTINAYHLLLETIGAIGENALTCPIDYERFCSGSTIFAFSRAPDLDVGCSHLPNQTGNLTLRINFAEALSSAVTCIVMLQFDSRMEINEYKNIITDYPI